MFLPPLFDGSEKPPHHFMTYFSVSACLLLLQQKSQLARVLWHSWLCGFGLPPHQPCAASSRRELLCLPGPASMPSTKHSVQHTESTQQMGPVEITAGHPQSSSTLPILTVTSYPHWTQAMHKTAKFKGFANMEQSQTFGPTSLHMTSLNNNNNQKKNIYIYRLYNSRCGKSHQKHFLA